MQIIYAGFFVIVSIVAFLLCVAVPSFRRYRLRALLAPVAFGFSSVLGAASLVLVAVWIARFLGIEATFASVGGRLAMVVFCIVLYTVCGAIGSAVAISLTDRFASER